MGPICAKKNQYEAAWKRNDWILGTRFLCVDRLCKPMLFGNYLSLNLCAICKIGFPDEVLDPEYLKFLKHCDVNEHRSKHTLLIFDEWVPPEDEEICGEVVENN